MSPEIEMALAKVQGDFPDRIVRVIDMAVDGRDSDETLSFVATGPNREEWRRYRKDIASAKGDPEAVEAAVERITLLMVRYPSRDEMLKIFDQRPGIIVNFGAEIQGIAGSNAEARAKK